MAVVHAFESLIGGAAEDPTSSARDAAEVLEADIADAERHDRAELRLCGENIAGEIDPHPDRP